MNIPNSDYVLAIRDIHVRPLCGNVSPDEGITELLEKSHLILRMKATYK